MKSRFVSWPWPWILFSTCAAFGFAAGRSAGNPAGAAGAGGAAKTSAPPARAAEKATERPPGRFDPTAVDRSADPCTDFYQYACGAWMKDNPIPADQPAWGRGSELGLRNQQVLRDILEKTASEGAKGSANDQRIGDHYASCMDEAGIEKKGLAALKPEMDRIAALRDKAGLATLLGHLHRTTGAAEIADSGAHTPVFGLTAAQDFDDATKVVATIDQGGLGLPDRDYYLKTEQKSQDLLKKYEAHVRAMFTLLGEPAQRAAASARTVVDMETALARASMDIVKRRDAQNLNHPMSQKQIAALTPSFSWDAYLKEMGVPQTQHFQVYVPAFLGGVEALIKERPLADWQTYLRWHLLRASVPLLPKAVVNENFAFYGKTLRGAKELRPRWKRCVALVDGDLGEALGRAYVERTFGAEGKERMLRLVGALERSLEKDIQTLAWMSPVTRKEAQAKLVAIENKIGYPERWRDYSSLRVVRGDALGNAGRASAFEVARQLAKIGKPVDRAEWLMTPSTVNAYYDPQLNTINFPAGILQPPFFERAMDDAVNLGAIGSVIGHELTHGFDDSGRKFDAKGNLRDWWTKADGQEFERRAQCIADQYGDYVATADVKLNGKLTLGENTADAGGLRIALMALRDLVQKGQVPAKQNGLSAEQRFFLAYANAWCSNMSPEILRVIAASNPHSPPRYRVNGVVSNLPEFAKTWSCKPGQTMVRKVACRVW